MSDSSPDDHHHRKKRVGKACDSCRVKKTKCDGKKPCSRCIADNKLCAFTEKRKSKEKAHPSGYIELLETRIDLLTQSLSKVVAMAEPHLPFLQQIMAQSKIERAQSGPGDPEQPEAAIPINEIVSYLVAEGDFSGENSDRLAASTSGVSSSTHSPTKAHFSGPHSSGNAEHGRESNSAAFPDAAPFFSGSPPPSRPSSTHSVHSMSIESFPTRHSSYKSRVPGADNGAAFGGILQSPPTEYASLESLDQMPPQSLFQSRTTLSTSPSSISSLSNKFENHSFENVRRAPAYKRRNSGHIHKPPVPSHSSTFPGHSYPGPGARFGPRAIPDFVPSFADSRRSQPPIVTPFDFENDLLFNEPPSTVIGNAPQYLDNDELSMTNPFLGTT